MKTRQTSAGALNRPADPVISQAELAAASLAALAQPLDLQSASQADATVVIAAAESRYKESSSVEAVVVSDVATADVDAAPASASSTALMLLAQAAPSQQNDKGGALSNNGNGGNENKDDKGAAALKDDDDGGGAWWLLGLGLLAAGGGGGGGAHNTPAVISGTASGDVKENGMAKDGTTVAVAGTATAHGDLNSTDVDNPADAWQVRDSQATTHGSYSIDATGHWTYTLNNDDATVMALNTGSTLTDGFSGSLTDTFVVYTVDGTAKTVTIAIEGTNDAAIITGTTSGSVTEAGGYINSIRGTYTATGDLNSTDVDNTADTWQEVTTAANSDSNYGTYTVDASGHWTYTLHNDNATVMALNSNSDPLTDTFTVLAADGTSQQISITIHGADDFSSALLLDPAAALTTITALQFNAQPSPDGTFKSAGSNSTPIDSTDFFNGMGLNLADSVGHSAPLTYVAYDKTVTDMPTDGQFTFVTGNYSSGNLTIGSSPDVNGKIDIMVMWDQSDSANTDYGYVLKDVAVNSTFVVEGLTFTLNSSYQVTQVTSVLPA